MQRAQSSSGSQFSTVPAIVSTSGSVGDGRARKDVAVHSALGGEGGGSAGGPVDVVGTGTSS